MTQQILMILPSTEDEKPRMVGPFLTEATANNWADTKEIDPIRRVIRPLESPTSIYGYGRHALIPSPGPRGGIAAVLHDAIGPSPEEDEDPGPEDPHSPYWPVRRSPRDLAAGGSPVTRWAEEHADQLRRFVLPELPEQENDR